MLCSAYVLSECSVAYQIACVCFYQYPNHVVLNQIDRAISEPKRSGQDPHLESNNMQSCSVIACVNNQRGYAISRSHIFTVLLACLRSFPDLTTQNG
jgi:hypothetical protein